MKEREFFVRGGIDFGDAVYGLREVDEKGTPLPDKNEEFAILVVPDRSIDKKGIIIRVEDKAYPLVIPEGMKPKQGLSVFFDDKVGLSEIFDAKGGPEDIFEKAQYD